MGEKTNLTFLVVEQKGVFWEEWQKKGRRKELSVLVTKVKSIVESCKNG